MYSSSCSSETRYKYFLGMIDFLKKSISFFGILDFINFYSISALATASSCFKKFKSSSVLTL